MKRKCLPAGRQGFVAISVVLIVISVVLAVGTTITLLSVGEAQSGLVLFQGEDNLNLIEGCVDDAMLKIRSDSTYAGGALNRPEGSCTVTVNFPHPNWNITVSASSNSIQRSVQVIFVKNPTGISLTSWKEI